MFKIAKFKPVCVASYLFWFVGCSAHNEATQESSSSQNPSEEERDEDLVPLEELQKVVGLDVNFIPKESLRDLWDDSDVVVQGAVQSWTPGRTIRWSPDGETGAVTETVVAEVKVDEVLKGEYSTCYIEFIVGNAEGVTDVTVVNQAALFFAVEAIDDDTIQVTDRGRGFPEGAKLLTLTAPEGLIVNHNGKVEHLLAPQSELVGEVSSLDEVVDELRGYVQ